MPFDRKKQPMIRTVLKVEGFLSALFLVAICYVMGCPERLALHFFIFLTQFGLTRISFSLILLGLFLFLFILLPFVFVKELRWNNRHLSLPVIEIQGENIILNNYNDKRTLPISEIEKLTIMNKDTVIQFTLKDKKNVQPDYLKDNRKAYETLKDYLKAVNPEIVFDDHTVSNREGQKEEKEQK